MTNKFMVSVTSEEQFYDVAQFAAPDSYIGDMYDVYEDNSVVIVDVDSWFYGNFEQSLILREEFGYPISFEEFEMRYLETVPVDKVMTHDDEVKTIKDDNIVHVNIGSKTWEKYMEALNKEDDIAGDSTNSQNEVTAVQDMVNHPSHYNQFSREVIDTMQGMSTPEEFKGHLKLTAVKYISRYQGKDGVKDLEKAIWYVTKLKEVLEEEQ